MDEQERAAVLPVAGLDYFYDEPATRPSHLDIGDIIAGRPPSHR